MSKTLAKADVEARKAADAGTFSVSDHGRRSFQVGDQLIQYFGNGGGTPEHSATNFYVRGVNDKDDLASDYWSGSFHKTLTAAIRFARRWNAREERLAS